MEHRTYSVRGMDCAEEITALRGTVGKLPGVTRLDFNLLAGTMTAGYDEAQLQEAAIPGADATTGAPMWLPE